MLHLDHIFILVSPGAPEADALLEIGLVEGTANEHPGQGTSNRRFFFANTTLEFLFIHDIGEAMNGAGRDLKFVERAIDAGSSPFGLITRWVGDEMEPDFPFWEYQPDYFSAPMCFYVGKNSDNFEEPMCICMPTALPLPASPQTPNNSDWILTTAEVSFPHFVASETLTAFGKCEMVTIRHNEDHRLKLVFNEAVKGESMNFLPDLPLAIEW